jgi:hypothetical protein
VGHTYPQLLIEAQAPTPLGAASHEFNSRLAAPLEPVQTLSTQHLMPKWKNNAIDLYRALTRASRALSVRQMKRRGQLPVFIVFYHRIANTHLNDWTMTTEKFQQQMEWLQSNFDMVDLAECQRRIRSGHNDRPTVSVTFDDGYAENGEFAIPYLIDHGIPTTYFVTTHHTVNQ